MQKQQRRTHFQKKQHHQKKEKQNRKQEVQISEKLSNKLEVLDLQGIINFMNDDYETVIQKTPQIENNLNTIIVKRIEELKAAWKTFTKEKFLNFLKKNSIPFKIDPKLSFIENLSNIYKKDWYYLFRNNIPRASRKGEMLLYVKIHHYHANKHQEWFYVEEFKEDIDFRIDFKRMKKDTLFQCQNFLDLVKDVELTTQEKWQPK